MANLPERLRLLRAEKNMTQTVMARKIMVPRVTYTHYELGKRTPDLDTIIHLARFHEVSIDYLVGSTELRPTLEQWLRENRWPDTQRNRDSAAIYDTEPLPPLGRVADAADERSKDLPPDSPTATDPAKTT